MEGDALIWVKDSSGNRYLCPMNALKDPNTLNEEDKRRCVDDAGRLDHPDSVPGVRKLNFSHSESLS